VAPLTRALIVSASIGEGHDLPARFIADDVRALGGEAIVADGLAAMGTVIERIVASGSAFESEVGARVFEAQYWMFTQVPPLRAFTGWGSVALGGRALLRLVAALKADVVVSTYPGTSEVLGRLRASGRLGVPAVSAITDLAALRYWSHPGLDLHLVTHPESVEEVRAIAGAATRIVPARGMNDPAFCLPRSREDARRALGLPLEPKVVVVSGGGWGVGDVEGAVATALAADGAHVVVMCGRNEGLRARLAGRFGDEERVRLLGFTDQVPDLFAAADALVHSTAGLTVLEAIQRGCPAISYGWGRGHIRANNRAFRRFGLADVATTPAELATSLRRALAARREPDLSFAALPSAGALVLGMPQPADRR
jgi:UDP-N-acetylglucosamine:LPS N-acetylglucosamine transferase